MKDSVSLNHEDKFCKLRSVYLQGHMSLTACYGMMADQFIEDWLMGFSMCGARLFNNAIDAIVSAPSQGPGLSHREE